MKNDLASSPVLRFLVVLLFMVITASAFAFSLYLLFYNAKDMYTYLVATALVFLSGVSGFFNIVNMYSYYRSSLYNRYLEKLKESTRPLQRFPTVAVAMAVYNENTDTVERNLLRLQQLKYPKSKLDVYLLDDSTDPEIRSELMGFSKKNGIRYMHRGNRKGFKAGALNNMLKHCSDEFIAIFDYDEYLTNRNFLLDILPYFHEKNVSFVQTEKRYSKGNLFSDTIDLFDAYFFKFIQPSRALNNTTLFAGSCGIIRRSALIALGGFPEYIIEDTFFSLESSIKEYKGYYIPKIYALGKPIKTFSELARQQWRYNYGDTQFLFYFVNMLFSRKKKLEMSRMSRVDYVAHGFALNYLSTIFIVFTIVSALLVFSSSSLANISVSQLFTVKSTNSLMDVFGVVTFMLSVITPIIIVRIHFKSFKKGIMVFFLNFALAFIRFRAAIAASLNSSPFLIWARDKDKINQGNKPVKALRMSIHEVMFSSLLVALSIAAFLINNILGALWLMWYATLYISAFFFFYKYG